MIEEESYILGVRRQLRRDLSCGAAHIARQRNRPRTIELVTKADSSDGMGDRGTAVQNRHPTIVMPAM